LGNVLERIVALCGGDSIELDDIPGNIRGGVSEGVSTASSDSTLPTDGVDLGGRRIIKKKQLIQQALEASKFSQKKAAQLLNLTPRALRYRLQKYDMEVH
jgi:DNA-binding NtrC family response regulator